MSNYKYIMNIQSKVQSGGRDKAFALKILISSSNSKFLHGVQFGEFAIVSLRKRGISLPQI